MKTPISILLAGLASASFLAADEPAKCTSVSAEVAKLVKQSPSSVLEVVANQVAASPTCACEIVKSAIKASGASATLVSAIVDTAILEAPESKELIGQCATAAAPDATSEIQKILAKYDTAKGDMGYSEKGGMAKGGMAKGGMPKGGMAPDTSGQLQDFGVNIMDTPILTTFVPHYVFFDLDSATGNIPTLTPLFNQTLIFDQ